jgi:predicted component of type VI protein secretion system
VRVKELRSLAANWSEKEFVHQLGPFVLIQRPPREVLAQKAMEIAQKVTSPSKRDREQESALAIIHQFHDLMVASLPPMMEKDELVVGRLPDCDLIIEDPSVSKRHAVLKWDAKKNVCSLKDLGSSNGTFVDEARLGRSAQELKEPVVLSFGDVDYWFMPTATLHWKLVHWR